LIKVVI